MRFIAKISSWAGKAAAWCILPLVFELIYDALMRYFFNAPTVWSFDVSYMLYSVLFLLGGAYTLLEKEHIRVDMFYEKFSCRGKAIVDVLGFLFFFFPAIGCLFIYGINFAGESWRILEHSNTSYWSPPIYYFKTLLPVGAFLLLLQGLSDLMQAISDLTAKKEGC